MEKKKNMASLVREVDEVSDIVELAKKIRSGEWIILNWYYPTPDKPKVVIGKIV